MAHLSELGPDTGVFDTQEVRAYKKVAKSTSRMIRLPRNHYEDPPKIAAGFRALDLKCKLPVRANIVIDDITTESFKIACETWSKSVLYSAAATWIEHKENARDCIFGQFDTVDVVGNKPAEKENSKTFEFDQPFRSDVEVICWLNRLDINNEETGGVWRIKAYASDVSRAGFTAHIDTWGGTILDGAAMCWIAFPKEKKNVQSGTVSTRDLRSASDPKPKNSARVTFRDGVFGKDQEPKVLIGLNMLAIADNSNLRVRADVDEISSEGFRWHLDTWSDSTLYGASASWIALG